MKRITLVLFLIAALFLVTTAVSAMVSANYRLDWYEPLTAGGGAVSSAHYVVNYTVGQGETAGTASGNYKIRLGYWAGILPEFKTMLPFTRR